jgi:hypothetical protein
MSFIKDKDKFIFKPSTIEIFHSLSDAPRWVKLLLGSDKEYSTFLEGLIRRDFYSERDGRITIKKICEDLKLSTAKANKWLEKIYDDLLELNDNNPSLFKSEGVKHSLHFKYFDSHASLNIWLNITPRRHERFECFFIKAKVGTGNFWVENIYHDFKNSEQFIHIFLDGKTLNVYRELLIEQAKFEGVISYGEMMSKKEFEIDEILKGYYKFK